MEPYVNIKAEKTELYSYIAPLARKVKHPSITRLNFCIRF